VQRLLSRSGLAQVTAFISRMASADLAELEGVSVGRAHQTLAGAVVAAAAMDALDVDEVELCPWALREGIILRRLDWLEAG
jgi:exopolyphosphatase/guanosine-5'-triphosphate,3'-diphosphate pyrophosphatase